MNKKIQYRIELVDKNTALTMVKKYHYSNTLPRLNKYFVGFFLNDCLVGLVTLGWGTRPRHTIQKLFPELDTKDYFEIGRMCMTEEMPRNSESQMLSQLMRWIKINLPDIKVVFTWADGMLGKCGYVYQASNFMYAGKIVTDIYLKDGIKIHPRQTKALFGLENDKRKTVRPTKEQMKNFNIQHFRGNQYKYVYFVCNKRLKKKLIKRCSCKLDYDYPKDDDLKWQRKDLDTGKWVDSCIPDYMSDSQFKTNFNEEFKEIDYIDIVNKLIEIAKDSTLEGNWIYDIESLKEMFGVRLNRESIDIIKERLEESEDVADVQFYENCIDIMLYQGSF